MNLYDKVHCQEEMHNQLEEKSKDLICDLSGLSYKKLLNNILKIKLYGKQCTTENIVKMCSI